MEHNIKESYAVDDFNWYFLLKEVRLACIEFLIKFIINY